MTNSYKESRAVPPKKKMCNIMEVNEDRKSEMNFDLEILGNKKEVVSTAKK